MNRRGFITGMAGILAARAAPAIITTSGLLMPVREIVLPYEHVGLRAIEELLLRTNEILIDMRWVELLPPDRKWFTLR